MPPLIQAVSLWDHRYLARACGESDCKQQQQNFHAGLELNYRLTGASLMQDGCTIASYVRTVAVGRWWRQSGKTGVRMHAVRLGLGLALIVAMTACGNNPGVVLPRRAASGIATRGIAVQTPGTSSAAAARARDIVGQLFRSVVVA